VLFIIAGEPKENPQGLSLSEKRFPTGVGYLISVLRDAGYRVDFLDRYLLGDVWPQNWNYDLVGIYTSTVTFPDALKIIEKVPDKVPIAMGGPHTSFNPESIPEKVKWICQGEGERAILDIASGKLPKGIYRYPRIENLDTLPMPSFDIFDKLPYLKTVPWFKGKVFNMCTSRGCPYRCSFCLVYKIWGRKVTFFSAERIVQDIEKVIRDYGVEGIYFREDNFTFSPKRVERFCKILRDKNIKLNWACEARCDTPLELLENMAKSGCKAIYVGIESGSDKMLQVYNKGFTVSTVEKFISKCKEVGIRLHASFIKDHPEETKEDKEATKRLIEKFKPPFFNPFFNTYREDFVIPKA